MSTRAETYQVQVRSKERLSGHLVRLRLGSLEGLGFTSSQISDEWIGLVVPGQFQSRYYTVRSVELDELVIDIVIHAAGLVTEWAMTDCVGDTVTITEPRGSFTPSDDAQWLMLVGDLTALPAIARIAEETALPTRIWAESPEQVDDYLPAEARWSEPGEQGSGLADLVTGLDWPEGPGYFWMAGESAQMRAIRKHLMRERKLATWEYDVMGYWRAGTRQPRAVDPGPIWRAGKAAGKSDDEIWADYDRARDA